MMTQTRETSAWQPQQVMPGPEARSLPLFFHDCTWVGTVYANMQAPGSPEMEARGGMRCQWIMDGLWLECDGFQDQFVDGEKILTWKLHLVVGWDVAAHEYRAILVDNNGVSALLRGEMDGPKLVMTPLNHLQASGQQVALRFVWDATDPNAVLWRNEVSVAGGPWALIEDYVTKRIR